MQARGGLPWVLRRKRRLPDALQLWTEEHHYGEQMYGVVFGRERMVQVLWTTVKVVWNGLT